MRQKSRLPIEHFIRRAGWVTLILIMFQIPQDFFSQPSFAIGGKAMSTEDGMPGVSIVVRNSITGADADHAEPGQGKSRISAMTRGSIEKSKTNITS